MDRATSMLVIVGGVAGGAAQERPRRGPQDDRVALQRASDTGRRRCEASPDLVGRGAQSGERTRPRMSSRAGCRVESISVAIFGPFRGRVRWTHRKETVAGDCQGSAYA